MLCAPSCSLKHQIQPLPCREKEISELVVHETAEPSSQIHLQSSQQQLQLHLDMRIVLLMSRYLLMGSDATIIPH